MTYEQLTKLLVFAIIGAEFRDMQHAIEMERAGFARFSGNRHNEDWKWKKDALKKLNNDELFALYNTVSKNKVIE